LKQRNINYNKFTHFLKK